MGSLPADDWVPLSCVRGSDPAPLARSCAFPPDDLFGDPMDQVRRLLEGASLPGPADLSTATRAAFVVAGRMVLTADVGSVRASHLQCLIAHLANDASEDRGRLQAHVIDAAAGLTLWSHAGAGAATRTARTWRSIVGAGSIDRLAAMTTPSLYGNKLRLTRFIAPIAAVSVSEGAPMLDLMAGTGVMTRALADRHPVTPNDPNPYAALLSGGQRLGGAEGGTDRIVEAVRSEYNSNHAALSRLVGRAASEEAHFLHGEVNADALGRYVEFVARPVLEPTDGAGPGPARLVTERYANVYFGVAQAVEIDSLRHAIEVVFQDKPVERELCLVALVVACATCASGPHFAQPIQARSERMLRTLVERRARSVVWEFELALARLGGRRAPKFGIRPATRLNWRDSLAAFAEATRGAKAAVYVDPPYSKLQYSRYYHVLNVLLSYDYPTVEGSGRYPPRSSRFSSRFEYQPLAAKRELEELLGRCAEYGLVTLLSYSDSGFVGTEGLLRTMSASFARVERFSERIRHHPQGRPLATGRTTVQEEVLVGHPS